MSRKSSRSKSIVSVNSSEITEENVENGARRLRSKGVGNISSTPTRKSERSKNSAVLYNVSLALAESSEDSTMDDDDSPSLPKQPSRGKRAAHQTPVKIKKEVKGKEEQVDKNETGGRVGRPPKREKVVQNVQDTTESSAPRKSTRTPKPPQRLLVEAEANRTSKGEKATPIDNVTTSESTKKSTRTRKVVENSVGTPKSAKVLKKDEPITPETPRSTRRKAAGGGQQPQKETPVKVKAPVKTTVSKKNESVPNEAIQEKKMEWKFNVYGIPKCPLPCHEEQFEEIWKFLFENVTEKNSGCMYVSGVPGTGKTVIVQAVIDTMQKVNNDKVKEKKTLQFKYLYINGLTLASPDKIWKRMFKGLELSSKSHSISTKEALKRLDSYFESHQRNPVVLVVDELDQILDKQQSILYQLLEWSSHAKNMFSFVAIFNTMSLPEHGLAMRNYSRMGFKRAVFPPYSYEQLQAIVSNMLSTFKTSKLSTEAVTLLSRKVAAISGDARRALEIARRALEIAESGNLSGIQAVSNAFKEIFSSAKIETIKHTSLLEQLILRTICDEVRCSGVEEVLIAKIYENVIPKAVYEGMDWPKDEILKALMRLAIMHLVIVEDNFPSLHKRVLLKVPVEDVNFALGIHTNLET